MLHRHTDTHLLVYYNNSLLVVNNSSEGYDSYDELRQHTEVFVVSGPEEMDLFDPTQDHTGNRDPDGRYVIDYGYHDHLLEQINQMLQPGTEQTAAVQAVPDYDLVNRLVKNYTCVVYNTTAPPAVQADMEAAVVVPEEKLPVEMTALAQYFAAHSMWLGALSRLQIQAGSARTKRILHTELLPHFENKKQSAEHGDMQTFYMYRLRDSSRALFEHTDTGALAIVHDLYRHHNTEDWFRPGVQNSVEYLIHTEHLEHYIDPDLDHLSLWIKDSYLAHGQSYLVMPLGWMLDDSLLRSVALRFFAGVAPAIRLHVETGTGRVILVELCAEEPAHEIQLSVRSE